MKKILIINLGSTSSKCAIYQDETLKIDVSLRHTRDDLNTFVRMVDQLNFRKQAIEKWLTEQKAKLSDFDLFVSRGALMKAMESGIYKVDASMLDDLINETYATHASNLGLLIVYDWANTYHKEAIFLNPPSTDELQDLARYTGIKGVYRRCAFHALNKKQIALDYA